MRTRRSPRNQDILWRALGPTPAERLKLPEWRVLVGRRKCDRADCAERAEFYKRTEPGWTFYRCHAHR